MNMREKNNILYPREMRELEREEQAEAPEGASVRSGFFSRKGQMFIIAAILILVAIIAIKNLLGIYTTFEEKRSGEMFTLDRQLSNLKNEMRYTVGIASMRNDTNMSGIRFLYNFSNFTVSDMDAKMLYGFVFVNDTNQKFWVTLGNFLKDTINATINATDSTPTGFTFLINSSVNETREFQSDVNGNVNVTITYSRHNENTTERFVVLASTRRYVAIFSDITLENEDEFVRSKDFYNRTW